MYAFAYHRPATLAEAVTLLTEHEDAKALAGGQTLLPTLKQRLAQPGALVDLSAVPDLKGVTEDGDGLRLGAFTRHAEVAGSGFVRARIPALASLAGEIGDRQVRHLGTLGGSIANADPAADYPAALVALKADIHTDGRVVGAEDFFTGMFETALEPGELVVSVRFAVPDAAAYAKFRNPVSRYPLAGVFVARFGAEVRVAVTGAAPSVFRATEMEAALAADFRADALAGIAIDDLALSEDIHAAADYRAHLVSVVAKRAVAACTEPKQTGSEGTKT